MTEVDGEELAVEPFQPVRTRTVGADVLQQVLERIRSGHLSVGDYLPGERVIAEQMDVSRATVRLAIERLVEAGIVRVEAGRGGGSLVVSLSIPPELDSPVTSDSNAESIFGLLEARRTLEPRVAQLAALRGTSEQLDRMEDSIRLLKEHSHDIRLAALAESRFHRVMWRAAGNPSLERMMIEVSRDLSVVHDAMLRTPNDYAQGVHLHVATLEAIRRGDPAEIEHEMVQHLVHFEVIVEDVLRQRAHRIVPDFLLAGNPRPPRTDG